MLSASRVTVIYLWRKVNEPRFAEAFFKSIERYQAGVEYELIFAAKGYSDGEFIGFERRLAKLPCTAHKIVRFPDTQPPISIFRDISANCSTEFVLPLVSWSRILARNWLAIYVDAFEKIPNCGIVGASGSYERTSDLTPFPNIAIRSNAFMVRAELFNSLDAGRQDTLVDGNAFEAGPNGMTKQVIARGLQPVVVDRFGGCWLADEWPEKPIFRVGEQDGLIIADNRTHQYACGSRRKRGRLVERAWGANAKLEIGSPFRKLVEWAKWNYPCGPVDLIPDLANKVDSVRRKLCKLQPNPQAKVFPS